jgi:hypothetical protein
MSLFFEEEAVAARRLMLDKLNETVTRSLAAALDSIWELREAGSSFKSKNLYQHEPFPPRVPPALHGRGSRCGSCRHCTEEEKAARSKNLDLSLPPEAERMSYIL